jgi:L-asparaginase / beta-aspartyl-peptidase
MFGLAIHGGAGTLPRNEMSAEAELAYRSGLDQALAVGYAVLESGGGSVDAVTAAVVVLEDNPLFNAGRGAVFTLEGRNELDASIMEGSTLKAGAVCGLTQIKNPIELAKAVMQRSEHVMLAAGGAEEFARSLGIPPRDGSSWNAFAAATHRCPP